MTFLLQPLIGNVSRGKLDLAAGTPVYAGNRIEIALFSDRCGYCLESLGAVPRDRRVRLFLERFCKRAFGRQIKDIG